MRTFVFTFLLFTNTYGLTPYPPLKTDYPVSLLPHFSIHLRRRRRSRPLADQCRPEEKYDF
jgi:hypothetical protein